MKPRFITFTGFDKFTDIRKAVELALRYPIEYGFLFSPTKIDQQYYKNISETGQFMLQNRLRIKVSAHLCGKYADMVNSVDQDILTVVPELKYFNRWQVNSLGYELENCARYTTEGREIILQTRLDEFPLMPYPGMYWLYDRSGGQGIIPQVWPPQGEANQFVGYAGGINSENVLEILDKLVPNAYSYWIDLESGVRTNGLFDLNKVEEVCKKVYGEL